MAASVTLITETFNLAEGQSLDALGGALRSLSAIGSRRPDLDIMLVDPVADPALRDMAARLDPKLVYLPLPGLSYDAQKTAAVRHVASDLVVFLDGDCRPASDTWIDAILAPFEDPSVSAVGGLTLYDDLSPTGQAMSILDFGYLFVADGSRLGCYASNNVAFRRSAWIACPPPADESLRSNCFAHAQLLGRSGHKLVLRRDAFVTHELPDVGKERLRRGYDLVSACWANPRLSETGWLDAAHAAERIMQANVALHDQRLKDAPESLCIDDENRHLVIDELNRLRSIDLEGVKMALGEGEATGRTARSVEAHHAFAAELPAEGTRDGGGTTGLRGTVFLQIRNNRDFVVATLHSLLAQWRPDLDLLVVDDASTDASFDVIRLALADHPEIACTLSRNARSLGIGGYHDILRHSASDIFIQADSDDINLPGRLDAIMACFETDPSCRLVSSNAMLMSERGVPIGLYDTTLASQVFNDPVAAARATYAQTWLGTTTACHRSVLTDFPLIDPDLCPYGFDLIAAFRALLLGSHHYIAEPMVGWRQHARNSHRLVGANARESHERESYGAIEIMALAQKLRDVEAIQARAASPEHYDAARDACRATFFDQFVSWSRLRNRLAAGLVTTAAEPFAQAAIPPIVTLSPGHRRRFGTDDPLGAAAARWSGFHGSEAIGTWMATSAMLVFRTPIPATTVTLSILGLFHLGTSRVRVSVDYGPWAQFTIDGEAADVTLPAGPSALPGHLVLAIHAPDAVAPFAIFGGDFDRRILGAMLLAVEIG